MTHFIDIKEKGDLKSRYRKLSFINHPDKGGEVEKMQEINSEYNLLKHTFGVFPEKLQNVMVGNFVFVNKSTCVVVAVENNLFKAKSFKTAREAMFDKETGYGVFNLNIKAYAN